MSFVNTPSKARRADQ